MNLNDFEKLARSRRSVRRFTDTPIEEGLLDRLLEIAHWAPSGYNLQPTHYVIADDPELKRKLQSACMNQKQIGQAPATVIFTGDRNVVENHFESMLAMELKEGSIDKNYETVLRKFVPLGFDHGPAGIGWFWKSTLLPFVRWAIPVPNIPAVHKRYWLTKQVMLNAMIFMLAASAADLATVPMEGFDESRVKKVLGIPASHIVPIVIPVGHPVDAQLKKTRLPIQSLVHRNGW